jgi:IS30 family transposase
LQRTCIGKAHRGAIVSLVERKSRYTFLAHTTHKTADAVHRCITNSLAPQKKRVHTLTLDNGREFADHQDIAADLDVRIYFAHPYASWERGLSENTNGLV